jgi:D-amino-acid dehydrogenase
MSEEQSTEVLVIGGGVIGLCSAYYLARSGCSVTILEQDEIGSGASHGNAGVIVPSSVEPLGAPKVIAKGLRWLFNPESPLYIRFRFDLELIRWLWRFRGCCNQREVDRVLPILRDLNIASRNLYDDISRTADIDFGYHRNGILVPYITQAAFEQGAEEARKHADNGFEKRVLTGDEAREMEPSLTQAIVGAVYHVEDAHSIPHRFVQGMERIVESKGVTIHRQTEVTGFDVHGKRVRWVRTKVGEFAADRFVLATGSWSPQVARLLPMRVPIQPAKGYAISMKRTDQAPVYPMRLLEAKAAVTPMGDIVRYAGTLELAGMDLSINQRRVDGIRRGVGQFLRKESEGETVEVWAGLRPCTPDTLPIIEKRRDYENLIVATGHGMLGHSLGPITGKIVSQLVTGEEPEVAIEPLKSDRFK